MEGDYVIVCLSSPSASHNVLQIGFMQFVMGHSTLRLGPSPGIHRRSCSINMAILHTNVLITLCSHTNAFVGINVHPRHLRRI